VRLARRPTYASNGRYDQIMRLGWKVFIPITLVWIVVVGAMMQTQWAYLFH